MMISFADALKRLAGCRAAQPGLGQVLVASEIVDALLAPPTSRCVYCGQPEGEGHSRRCSVTKYGTAHQFVSSCPRCDGKATLDLSYLEDHPL